MNINKIAKCNHHHTVTGNDYMQATFTGKNKVVKNDFSKTTLIFKFF